MLIWHRLMLFPALFLTAVTAKGGDWVVALGLSPLLGCLEFFTSRHAISLLDLFDRSTLAFGIVAGVPFGSVLAREIDAGQSLFQAVFTALAPAGLVFLVVIAASFWVRGQLIGRSLRNGYFSHAPNK